MKEKVIERGYEIADAAKDLEAFYEYLPDKIYCDKSRMNEVIENCSKR